MRWRCYIFITVLLTNELFILSNQRNYISCSLSINSSKLPFAERKWQINMNELEKRWYL